MRCLCSFDTGFHCMILASLELRDTLASPLNVGIKSMSPQAHPKTCVPLCPVRIMIAFQPYIH